MIKIRRVETYLGPLDAARVTGLGSSSLKRYVRRGVLTQYRTQGGHRRYALSELRALRQKLQGQTANTPRGHNR